MKLSKILIVLYLLFLGSMKLNAQTTTDIELHNRYWTYRENFRKYFTKIGEKNGEGLPFSDIKVGLGADLTPLNNSGAVIKDRSAGFKGMLNVGGDVTYYFAEYLGILSSEYWLLKNQGKGESEEMKAVKNELYFAVYAVERLDKYSKGYYQMGNPDTHADGFFVRDDSEPRIINYLEGYIFPKVSFFTSIPSQGRLLDEGLSNRASNPIFSPATFYCETIKTLMCTS